MKNKRNITKINTKCQNTKEKFMPAQQLPLTTMQLTTDTPGTSNQFFNSSTKITEW